MKNILDGRKDGRMDRRTEVNQYTPSPFGQRGYNKNTSQGLDFQRHML
jgi:hypothetical protein